MKTLRAAQALVACCCLLVAGGARGESTAKVQACLEDNVPAKSTALEVELVSRHRRGGTSKHVGAIRWRRTGEDRSETLICMKDPPDLRGLAYLILETDGEPNLWGYLPEKQRVNRIHARGAARRARIGRTAIGYDDLRYLPLNISRAQPGKLREAHIEGRKVWQVELTLPPGDDSVYTRILSFIDPETCVPLRTEFYEYDDRLLKTATADPESIEQTHGIWVARRMRIEDHKNEIRTELRIEKLEINPEIPDRTFAPSRLNRNVCGIH